MAKKIIMQATNSIYSTFKYRDYKIYKAICEYIDNSTQSFFNNEKKLDKLLIKINYDSQRIEIIDNAFGMDLKELEKALELGSKPKDGNTRNQFGIGLKAASIWFTDHWKITTKKLGDSKELSINIKMDDLVNGREMNVVEVEVDKSLHYTKIELLDLNKRKIVGKASKKISDILSTIYKNDLLGGKIKIEINGLKLEPKEYEWAVDENNQKFLKDIKLQFSFEGQTYGVFGFVGIRSKGSTSETDGGFSLLNCERVIIPNWRDSKIFGAPNSYEYQRLVGELSLINFRVTNDKQNFDWDNGLFDKFLEELLNSVWDLKRKTSQLRFNEVHPLSKDEKQNLKKALGEDIKTIVTNEMYVDSLEMKTDSKQSIMPGETTKIDKSYKINNTDYLVHFSLDSSAKDDFIKYKVDDEKKLTVVNIHLNRNHSFLKPKLDNAVELINYINLTIYIVLSAIVSFKSSGREFNGQQFIHDKMFFHFFNDFLSQVNGTDGENEK